ncbi:amidohydrolase [Sphingobacterium faecale]|uniref:Amidohydrolase n=1 Tax=Sphingobacterium faecale TaxID=2803775 RepID=A0ABS1R5C6_9SPHI|nr:amidohydrolase [Sphingobacterium faecale]MBL1409895.1 amidohydrolase [Sphingobacterium faecale]
MKNLFLFFLTALLFIRCTSNTEVDLIVHNAKIYSVDSSFAVHEAFAVKNGIFIDIGTSKDILKRYKAKEIIDAQQTPVYPGFYDAHAHYFELANLFQEVDLNGTKSMEELIDRLQKYQQKNPDKKWIIGGGWDQNLWPGKAFPTKDSLDKYFPDIPIYLSRVDYHAALVNTAALKIARLDSVFEVQGGLISPDALGKPDGLLIDNAMPLVSKHLPKHDEQSTLRFLQQAQDSLVSVGLTSIVDAGLNDEEIDYLKTFYAKGQLKIRDYAMILADPSQIDRYIKEDLFETDRLTIRSIKLLADGALGSRGACLLEHYHDSPTKGFLLHTPEQFDETIKKLANSEYQVNTHAIGDSANRLILDVYGKYLTDNKARRWRIEHAQIIAPNDFAKFNQFHIIPSIQPTHATSDMYWAPQRLGDDRIKGAYAYKDLLEQYGKVAIGSDFPIEHFNPLYGFHAAIARVDHSGYPAGGFQMENALSREEALKGMTIWAAFSCFEEKKRGSIEKGKDADFVILAKDIMEVPYEEIRNVKTLRTVIGGETVFQRSSQ